MRPPPPLHSPSPVFSLLPSVADMIPDDVDEPPGSRLFRPSNLLLYALVMTGTVGAVKGERWLTADPLGYVGEFAVLELEVNGGGSPVGKRLQLGINVHKED